jgi:hypothetical protein
MSTHGSRRLGLNAQISRNLGEPYELSTGRILNRGSKRRSGCVACFWLVRDLPPMTDPTAVSGGNVARAGDA